jgi:hypothetical protein
MFKQSVSNDDELIRLCQSFGPAYSQWGQSIRTSRRDEDGALLELRLAWRRCLARIQEIQPQTYRSALAKFDVALMWSKRSGEFDSSARKFLAQAGRALRSFLPEPQPSFTLSSWVGDMKPRARWSWLAHVSCLPWSGSRLEADVPIGGRQWDERIRSSRCDEDDELRELRVTWERCLVTQEQSKTPRGALAKFDVALMWSEGSDEFDSSALKFLAESSRELRSLLPGYCRLALSCWGADIKWRTHEWPVNIPRLRWRGHRRRVDNHKKRLIRISGEFQQGG